MTINIADNTPRVSYSVSQGVTQTSFAVTFEFFDDEDLNVYVDGTQKTLTTDYTVSGGSGTTGTVTISVTGASGGSTVVITRSIELERTTDFPASGAFQIDSLNTELDRFTAISADLNDEISRSLRLTDYDTAVSLVLPDVNSRKGTVLAFDSSTGAVVAGPTTSGVNTLASIATDVATLADIEDGTVATNAISGLASISSNVTTVANISANVTTVAGITANIATVVANITDIQNAEEHAQESKDYAIKVNGQVQELGVNTGNYSSKAWATGGTGVTSTAGAGAAKEWATTSSNTTVDGTELSAKAYAIGDMNRGSAGSHSAKDWASYVSGVNTVDGTYKSARAYAIDAANAVADFNQVYYGTYSSDSLAEAAHTSAGNTVAAGDLYFSSTTNAVRYYDGTSWTDIAAVNTSNFATAGFAIAMSIAL